MMILAKHRQRPRLLQFQMFHWPVHQNPLANFFPNWPMTLPKKHPHLANQQKLYWPIKLRLLLTWPIKPQQNLAKLLHSQKSRILRFRPIHLLKLPLLPTWPISPHRLILQLPYLPNSPNLPHLPQIIYHHLFLPHFPQMSPLKCNPVHQIVLPKALQLPLLPTWPISTRSLHKGPKTLHWPICPPKL